MASRNSTNLHQVGGGNQVKQGDTASVFRFELQNEDGNKMDLTDQSAIVSLGQDKKAVWQKEVTVQNGTVSFTLDEVLEVGTYILEIRVGGYVFPSDTGIKIKVISANGEYHPKPIGVDSLKNPAMVQLFKEIIGNILEDFPRGLTAEEVDAKIQEGIAQEVMPKGVNLEEVTSLVQEAVAGLTLPKGDKGERGEKGETGPQGLPGKDGQSTYQIAVEHGFVGTEEEWLGTLSKKQEISPLATAPFAYMHELTSSGMHRILFNNGAELLIEDMSIAGYNQQPVYRVDVSGGIPFIDNFDAFPQIILDLVKGRVVISHILSFVTEENFPNVQVVKKAVDDEAYSFDNFRDFEDSTPSVAVQKMARLLLGCGAIDQATLEEYGIVKK